MKKDAVMQIRLSSEDKKKIKDAAKKSGLTVTDFIIKRCSDDKEVNKT
ncbi:plasmid mobilization protein [Clostridium saccharoperbutylacetonicum]